MKKLKNIIDFNNLDKLSIDYFFNKIDLINNNDSNLMGFFFKDYYYHIFNYKDSVNLTIPLQILFSNNKQLQSIFMIFLIQYKYRHSIYCQSTNQINFIMRFIINYIGDNKQYFLSFMLNDMNNDTHYLLLQKTRNKSINDLCKQYKLKCV
jgi:hypothetical protein